MSFMDRSAQVAHIKASVATLQSWTAMVEAASREFAAAKQAQKASPKDPVVAKKIDQVGEKLLSIMEARNECEASLIAARRLFRIYD
jgi:hypothetical protein